MTARELLAVACAALGAVAGGAGCRGDSSVTGLRIVTTWDVSAIKKIDQIEFAVSELKPAGGTNRVLVPPDRRPVQAGKDLASGADVVVFLNDGLAGTEVWVSVRGFASGRQVGTAHGASRLAERIVVRAELKLRPGSAGTKPNGERCREGSECASVVCANEVCCAGPCERICTACNVPGKQGTCVPVPAGARHSSCADQPVETCGFDGTCDGRGACRKHPAGARCTEGVCSGSGVSATGACDGDGQCMLGPVITCAPYGCDPGAGKARCFDRCTSSAECVAGRACVTGSCGKKLDGAECAAGAECASGFCADGVCCDVACAGPCVSCAQAGAKGTCRPSAAAIADPRKICIDASAASCGQTGACDGKGACARYPAGTVCQPGSCLSAALLMAPARCDGAGQCVPGSQVTCAPFACQEGACRSRCNDNSDCAPGLTCDTAGKSCGKKGGGQPCVAGNECTSGHCVDSVCCNEACQGPCRSCSLGAVVGSCASTAAGQADPRGMCLDAGSMSCGNDGTCNGSGGCRKYAVGTQCRTGSCDTATNMRTLPWRCDSSGACVAGATVSCSPYVCNASACFSACAGDSECVPPNICQGGACSLRGMGSPCAMSSECSPPYSCIGSICQLRPLGQSCTAGNQCASGFCAESVCCDQSDCGSCRSCKVAGAVGLCSPVAAGAPDPKASCAAETVDNCGRDGTCDGAGACRLYPAGTVCVPASCGGQLLARARTCDGAGVCLPGTFNDCRPYRCNPITAQCFSSCTSDVHCCCGFNCKGNNTCD